MSSNGIQTTQKNRRNRKIIAALIVAGVVISFLCTGIFLAGLVWDGRAGHAAQQEVGRVFGATPTPIPPPNLIIQSVVAEKGTVVVSGAGTPGADIEYLGNRVGTINPNGTFAIALPVDTALSAVVLEAVNRNGRTSKLIEVPSSFSAPGQSAAVGRVKLSLTGVGTDSQVGRPPLQTRAEGIYLKLIVKVVSELSEPLNLKTWNLVLQDGQGHEYRPSEKAEFAYGWDTGEGRLTGRVLPPKVQVTGWILFDIAPGATNLVLKANSEGIGPQWAAELAIPDDIFKGAK